MRSNFLKLVLPAFAILLAVGLAFATEDNTIANEGYYLDDFGNWITVTVEPECFNGGQIACTSDGHQLYAEKSTSSFPLAKN
ncbi:DUF6520 family protein [Flagellimonas profundi]|uniref:Uncharacterized protein n=1 Tax=Flagellimonas profundi TaxID=2915620 RepID=A0ABS3FF18_9FLAO|nr:DUF6520 family protein [Allomuricauda profundi]MBO0341512.1 hypothetical protein [Allomuricauda profundi]|tara:strand:- start:2032 stop:2277 length:246 start_codon:yes stop_codon:yes gene_type:complete